MIVYPCRDAVRGIFTGVQSMLLHYIGLKLLSVARCQVNAVELHAKVCFSFFDVEPKVLLLV